MYRIHTICQKKNKALYRYCSFIQHPIHFLEFLQCASDVLARNWEIVCFLDYAKAFDCVDHNKLWKTLKEMGIPHHLTCLLRSLYAGQEAIVRPRHGTDWFQIGKGVPQGYILLPCLFNLYAEYIMQNAGVDKAQAGIKTAGVNINNLRYAGDTTLMPESEKELRAS